MFQIQYNVTGDERKRLVKAISEYTGANVKFLGVPSCSYQVGVFTIDRTGCVTSDGSIDAGLIEALAAQGFEAAPEEMPANAEDSTQASDGLTISLPLDGFDPTSLDRLTKLIDSKASLIQKALGACQLTVQTDDDHVSFPWWNRMPEPEETQAYMSFIAALCAMAKEAKRVTATEKAVESEKYAFRGFLLRLGFIGAECKAQRKILLKNLSGSAAFPNKEKADAFSAAQKAKREVAPV